MNIGKPQPLFIREGILYYKNRLKHYADFEIIDLEISYKTKTNTEIIKTDEEKAILKHLSEKEFVILLDERGKMFSSREFSWFLSEKWSQGSIKQMTFVTGGAFGVSRPVFERANYILSLSPMTFPHQLVRLIFCEQLYRALTIIRGENYHHD